MIQSVLLGSTTIMSWSHKQLAWGADGSRHFVFYDGTEVRVDDASIWGVFVGQGELAISSGLWHTRRSVYFDMCRTFVSWAGKPLLTLSDIEVFDNRRVYFEDGCGIHDDLGSVGFWFHGSGYIAMEKAPFRCAPTGRRAQLIAV